MAAVGATLGLLLASQAQALMTTLDIELDDALGGTFATVGILENAGNLDFTIALDASLGVDADIHEFYFNLVDSGFTGVGLSTTDSPQKKYKLSSSPMVEGGAGASFDFGIDFGNGSGPSGNGTLQMVSFTVFADQNLSLSDLAELSQAKGGMIDLHFALHVQETSLVMGSDSETVGGMMNLPEPSAGFLLSLGLTALAVRRREPGL